MNIPQNLEKHPEASDEKHRNGKCLLLHSIADVPCPWSAQGLTLSQTGQSLIALGDDCNDPKISISDRIHRATVYSIHLKLPLKLPAEALIKI